MAEPTGLLFSPMERLWRSDFKPPSVINSATSLWRATLMVNESSRGHGNTLYFSEFGANRIARITTDGVVTESPPFDSSEPTGLTAGPHRTIWFLGFGNNRVCE